MPNMHVHYKFGLFLIFILSVSTCYSRAASTTNKSTPYGNDYPDDYDDDYYDDSDETKNNGTNRLSTTTTTTTTHKPLFSFLDIPKRSNHVIEPDCPKQCLCLDDYKHIKCSNARLTHVPQGIPNTALILDLSENRIKQLHSNDFENCTKLREINLSHNELTEINPQAFDELSRLKRLNLANNHLTNLQQDDFASVYDLDILDLSNNAIVLPEKGSFLNQPNLLELYCRNCSWSKLNDESFANLTKLTALKLDHNDFNKKINTKAFTPLRNLIKLGLPELDETSVQELCNLLKSIDNISFRHFDVSCYELVLGASYNESIIFATDPPYNPPSTADADAATTKTQQQQQAERDNGSVTAMSHNESIIGGNSSPSAGHEHHLLAAGVVATVAAPVANNVNGNDTGDGEKTYQVPISQETINIMLIGIMIIAIVGILIGVVCRKDVGGIKTKCCRTRKPEPKDQVHPTEEIPLNKLA